MSQQQAARTPGAKRAGNGEYVFDLAKVNHILGGPDYSTANGACVEGDRMIVGLMRMPAGTGAEPHSHPNEQWIYILRGHVPSQDRRPGRRGQAGLGDLRSVERGAFRQATAGADVVFFTCKDASHSLHGVIGGMSESVSWSVIRMVAAAL